ncbi:MAG: hypothetical protein KC657_10925, partial [Myxococcales bacterium]|nr:hypothetical protein [Myxococcales bacterium]
MAAHGHALLRCDVLPLEDVPPLVPLDEAVPLVPLDDVPPCTGARPAARRHMSALRICSHELPRMQSAWVVSSAGSRTMDWLPEQPVLLKKTQGTLRGSNPGQHESRRATASS